MKFSPLILLLSVAGCQGQGIRYQADNALLPKLTPDTPHLTPALTLPPPPAKNTFFFHFTYPVWPLTNGCLLSSTDLVHWEERQDYWLTTNADNSVEWNVHFEPTKSVEFFRARAETIEK